MEQLSQQFHVDVATFKKASRGRGIICDRGKRLIELVRKGCSHFAHQSYTVSMRHFFALDLHLQSGLLLSTHIKRHADCFQKIPVFISQTAAAHDHPTRLPVWQKKSMLALECSMQGARTIVFCFD